MFDGKSYHNKIIGANDTFWKRKWNKCVYALKISPWGKTRVYTT